VKKDSELWLVGFEPLMGKEAEYEKWFSKHINRLFECEDLKRISHYRRYVARYGANKEECPQYLAVHEFESKEAVKAFRQSSAFAAALTDFEESLPGLGKLVWSGWYRLQKILQRPTTNAPVLFIVATYCDPEKTEAFNHWYNEIHLPMLFEYKGMINARRYLLYQQEGDSKVKCPKYPAFYDFENKEGPDNFLRSPESLAARPDWDDKVAAYDIKPNWSGSFERITSLER
jgi:hypothetical protein